VRCSLLGLLLSVLALPAPLAAETGTAAWLRYACLRDPTVRQRHDALPVPTKNSITAQKMIRNTHGTPVPLLRCRICSTIDRRLHLQENR